MYLVVIAWAYVVLMVAVAEATSSNGTLLGATFTVLMWGVLPLVIVTYLMRSPAWRAARRASETAAQALAGVAVDPDGRGRAPGDAVAPERKEP